ncbi:MAG: CPBP family intramembrane metalloprotease [Clostridia bacterium]|nr:CPBP family intramembrane metalloprotease [Clostridia bacterium]MBQ4625499.1 CPBP family intramembrane metalloprotease [Clostridia bacterium]
MAVVDGILQPGYIVKSAIKIVLFALLPLLFSRWDANLDVKSFLKPQKRGLLISLALGVMLYGVILGAYFLIGPYFDFSAIAGSLTQNAGVTRDNFLYVSLYISFINSFLEEFFFRGFLFSNLKGLLGRGNAYLFSALLFSFYHVAMMIGWFSPFLFVLVMVGLLVGGMIFNRLNESLDSIYASWLTHMFANFAINTIGFMLL